MNDTNLLAILITGLTVGGLTCLAVQGGLLASTIAARKDESEGKKNSLLPIAAFLQAKLLAYVLLGFLLGAFGKALALSDGVVITMQIIAGLYMIAIALNLLNVHPIFRYAVIQPPRFITRMVRNQSKSKDLFAPALLGLMTIFIPCGTTLAMEALAISSGSPISGAMIMGAFILGTMPLFFGIGYLTNTLSNGLKSNFYKIAAVIVLYLGINSVNAGLVAVGSPLSLQSLAENSPIQIGTANTDTISQPAQAGTTQNPVITITSQGYTPNVIKVKKGEPVTLTLTSKDAFSCASGFRIPSLGISKNLQPNDSQKITFTPTEIGNIQFNCSMGMYRGVIQVI